MEIVTKGVWRNFLRVVVACASLAGRNGYVQISVKVMFVPRLP